MLWVHNPKHKNEVQHLSNLKLLYGTMFNSIHYSIPIYEFKNLIKHLFESYLNYCELSIFANKELSLDYDRDNSYVFKILKNCMRSIDSKDYLSIYVENFLNYIDSTGEVENNPYYSKYSECNKQNLCEYFRNQLGLLIQLESIITKGKLYSKKEIENFIKQIKKSKQKLYLRLEFKYDG